MFHICLVKRGAVISELYAFLHGGGGRYSVKDIKLFLVYFEAFSYTIRMEVVCRLHTYREWVFGISITIASCNCPRWTRHDRGCQKIVLSDILKQWYSWGGGGEVCLESFLEDTVVMLTPLLMKTIAMFNTFWCWGDGGRRRSGANERHTSIVHVNAAQVFVARNLVKVGLMDSVHLLVSHHLPRKYRSNPSSNLSFATHVPEI